MNSIKVTEEINHNSIDIHTKNIDEILSIFNSEDLTIIKSINNVLPDIEELITKVIDCFKNNGRLFYIGSGTSGRLGILDAAECPPTFGTSPNLVQGIIAGGSQAVFQSVEGAEDSIEDGMQIISKNKINPTITPIGAFLDIPFRSVKKSMFNIITINKNKTATAPT